LPCPFPDAWFLGIGAVTIKGRTVSATVQAVNTAISQAINEAINRAINAISRIGSRSF